ncbi:MAG: hypothetical protein SGJ11_12235 [Phycisphaerae bacterium]|nr:hypothetical protein [Phycisphaerae bacterium]
MLCKKCDYPLWNVAGRICPECGADFKPSEFEFQPAGVRYKCPHCATAYFGLSAQGHLVPTSFVCSTCQKPIAMDEMVLEPSDGAALDHGAFSNPWLARRSLVRPFFRSTGMLLMHPLDFARGLPVQGRLREAATYAGIALGVQYVISLLFQVALMLLLMPMLAGTPMMGTAFGGWGQLLTIASFGLIFWLLWLLFESTITHFLTRLFGATRATFAQTWQCYLYATGAGAVLMWAAVIPCVGAILVLAWFFWSIVVLAGMVQITHHMRSSAAVWAVTLARLASIGFAIVLGVAIFFVAPGLLGLPPGFGTRMMGGTMGISLAQSFATTYTQTGSWPRTPLDPYVNDAIGRAELLMMVDGSTNARSIGSLKTANVFQMDPADVQIEADALAARMPPPNVPFRLGDAVFVYPIATGDPLDWLIIEEGGAGAVRFFQVHRASGKEPIAAPAFASRLAQENARRAAAGRPPIPDPSTITDIGPTPTGAPAVR